MTSGPIPPPISVAPEAKAQAPAALQSSAIDSTNVFSPSSPIQPKSHPFLRKFHGIAGIPNQSQGTVAAAAGSSAFSTSAASSGQDSSDSSPGRKSVDEAIASVAAGNLGNKSPTLAAANATDAIINKRLGHHAAEGAAVKDGCCSGAHVSDDAYFDMDASHLPPVSAEARRFSEQLLGQNKAWAIKTEEERPGFFAKLEKQQKPQVLWIGKCNDSR